MEAQIRGIAKKAGRKIIELALTMFYCLVDSSTPLSVKSMILGDLAYLVTPFDLIPDITPGMGFSDDMAVLLGTMALIPKSIKKEHRAKAAYTVERWFSEPNVAQTKG